MLKLGLDELGTSSWGGGFEIFGFEAFFHECGWISSGIVDLSVIIHCFLGNHAP